MKFNDSQKKWAMTGVLLAVLGFNISPPKSMISYSLTDLASEKESFKSSTFEHDGKEYVAQYRKNGDQTDVTINKVEFKTESGSIVLCGNCSTSYVFDENFKTNTSELNEIAKELLTASEEAKTEEPAKRGTERVKVSKKEAAEDKEESLVDEKEISNGKKDGAVALQKAVDTCRDRHESIDAINTCISNAVQNLFTKSSVFNIDNKKVVEILKTEMIQPLGEHLAELRSSDAGLTYKDIKEQTIESLKPLGDMANDSNIRKTPFAKDLTATYKMLSKESVALAKAAWDNKNLQEFDIRRQDLGNFSVYYKAAQIVPAGMAQANEMSNNLQMQINNQMAQIMAGQGAVLSADGIIVVDGVAYSRVSSAGRGGATGVGITTLPGQVPVQVINGTFQSTGMPQQFIPSPAGTSTINTVPVQNIQTQSLGTGRTAGSLRY
ncbi:hypothetical protein [Bdellovibrio sp. HCB288]|uniref:hypothetical protein n=1 Tax=Bdellovibrio sp. HCB288 TaxID=3394355 RepID=UPI0039B6A3AD